MSSAKRQALEFQQFQGFLLQFQQVLDFIVFTKRYKVKQKLNSNIVIFIANIPKISHKKDSDPKTTAFLNDIHYEVFVVYILILNFL